MNNKRNRNMLRLVVFLASIMILIFNVSAASFNPIAEAAASKTLTMDNLKYLKTQAITLSYSGAGASGSDWVGIYKTGDTPPGAGVSLRWAYLKSGDGKVSLSNGLAPGTYDALFMLNDGYEIVDRKTFAVVDRVAVDGVTLDQQNVVMTEGETKTLTATVTPANANDPKVSWISSDPAIVSVTSTGGSTSMVGNSPGNVTVTAVTYDGNFTAFANVTVDPGVTLQSVIASAQVKFNAAVEGDGDGQFVTGSKAQLQSAIEAAKAIANDSNATKEQKDSAKAVLLAAIQEFDKMSINADVNRDGKRSVGDLAILSGVYGKQQGQEGWNERADVNHNGTVDMADFVIVSNASMQ